ncbi:hypothetical protein K5I29_12455 [Flavobacterium agricola]|uniref:Uncharacterized protein n=1 Tax=Flavobacterium agricola TaxID=2870839 RepID=A0ABY6LYC9_9FLAO|nr:hypothetical protein [Flavobacterium agricola]UYW01244.1 hypothetical protein K5I29_12455 [Flavobacterium agricola]
MDNNFQFPATVDQLFVQANQLDLYQALIQQLRKDFTLANSEITLSENMLPEQVFGAVQNKIFSLLHHDFAAYLNLLYIIDVPEHIIKKLDGSDFGELSYQISFLLLKREWQKVWFKKYY